MFYRSTRLALQDGSNAFRSSGVFENLHRTCIRRHTQTSGSSCRWESLHVRTKKTPFNRHRRRAGLRGRPAVNFVGYADHHQSSIIDGWTVSWPSSIELQVSQDSSNPLQVDLQETATFTAPSQGFQFTIAPTSGSTPTADLFVMTNESLTDNTAKAFADLSFILLNTGAADATITKVFTPPTGAGYDYTSDSIVNVNQEVDYTGTQNNGVTSLWGNGVATSSGNNLTIMLPANQLLQ